MTRVLIILIIAITIVIIAYKRSKRVRYITYVNRIDFANTLNDTTVIVTNSERGCNKKKLTLKPGTELKIYVNVGYVTLKYIEPED